MAQNVFSVQLLGSQISFDFRYGSRDRLCGIEVARVAIQGQKLFIDHEFQEAISGFLTPFHKGGAILVAQEKFLGCDLETAHACNHERVVSRARQFRIGKYL